MLRTGRTVRTCRYTPQYERPPDPNPDSATMDNVVEIFSDGLSSNVKISLDGRQIARVPATISYDEFFYNFMLPNQPCIIDSEYICNWRSSQDWVLADGSPNFDFLNRNFGSVSVPVADCNQQYFNAQKKCEQTLAEYLSYWEKLKKSEDREAQCLYMKDWHCCRDFPDYQAYEWPKLFSSDWLNEYWATKPGDDYRFVYMGPKGSWTPLHVDVLTSYSWSSNICGRKRWLLFPPGIEEKYRMPNGNLVFDFQLQDTTGSGIEVVQEAGEIIFVPSGWHHQVWNLEDTISINHNWFNGCCIERSWAGLVSELRAVHCELEDCKDMENWEEQCQIVLAATAGFNIIDFLNLLDCVAQTRIKCLAGNSPIISERWTPGHNHTNFDIGQILRVLPSVAKEVPSLAAAVQKLQCDITSALKKWSDEEKVSRFSPPLLLSLHL